MQLSDAERRQLGLTGFPADIPDDVVAQARATLGGVTDPWLVPRRDVVDPPAVVEVEPLAPAGEAVVEPDDRADMLAEAEHLDEMDKAQLDAFALNYFGVDLDRRKGLETLRAEVQALISDPHAHV